LKNKTILITGSSGFIGNFFLENALNKNFKIIDVLRYKNKNNKNLNKLRKKFKSSYKSIYYKDVDEIEKQLKNKRIDFFINFATFYKASHSHREIVKFINSNILFPSIILDLIFLKVKKVINFGSMMQHLDGNNYKPKNFYSSTKSAFEMILSFYSLINKKTKFYNLKLYESFAKIDKRKKLIPTLIKNFKSNKKTTILSSKLELNIVHIDDIIKAIYIILDNNIKNGTYCLKSNKNIGIKKLISKINYNSKKKIKVKYLNRRISKVKKTKIKLLPSWRADKNIQNKIMEEFL
jgi:nucleoside-diphosphate-sugar epimerase